jgi:hypothetical protein
MSITSTANRPTASAKTGTAAKIEIQGEPDADLDRLLGDKLLFDLKAPQTFGGPSKPSIYRARDAGLVEFVKNGNRSMLTRETMKRPRAYPLQECVGRRHFSGRQAAKG